MYATTVVIVYLYTFRGLGSPPLGEENQEKCDSHNISHHHVDKSRFTYTDMHICVYINI